MRDLFDSFWRAVAYCLHPRVIVLSLAPLLLAGGMTLALGYVFWEPAVAGMRATNGSEQSRLGFASELVTVNKANLEAASSRITDVDVAAESTQLARWNILVQAGTAMLARIATARSPLPITTASPGLASNPQSCRVVTAATSLDGSTAAT